MSQQQKTMPIPATITLDGRTAVQLKEYILGTPSPQQPVGVALELVGKVELALQKAVQEQQQPGTNGASAQHPDAVLAAARALVANADGSAR